MTLVTRLTAAAAFALLAGAAAAQYQFVQAEGAKWAKIVKESGPLSIELGPRPPA
jgi:hypothetical protein